VPPLDKDISKRKQKQVITGVADVCHLPHGYLAVAAMPNKLTYLLTR